MRKGSDKKPSSPQESHARLSKVINSKYQPRPSPLIPASRQTSKQPSSPPFPSFELSSTLFFDRQTDSKLCTLVRKQGRLVCMYCEALYACPFYPPPPPPLEPHNPLNLNTPHNLVPSKPHPLTTSPSSPPQTQHSTYHSTTQPPTLLPPHTLKKTSQKASSKKLRQRPAEINKVDRLRDIIIKPGLDTLVLHIRHDVGRQSDDGQRGALGTEAAALCLPGADFAAGLVAVFARHVEVAL